MTRYIEERRDVFGVEPICRVLEVPVSSFYARRSRVPSQRQLDDWQLLVEVEAARSGYRARTAPVRRGRSCAGAASRSVATASRA